MIDVMPYDPAGFDELADFLTRLNADPAHHIGFFGYGREEIAHTLSDFALPLEASFLLARRGERLTGAFGVEYDLEVGQAWLHGPMVDDPEWDAASDALYARALGLIPDGIGRRHLFADVANSRLQAFAARHGFEPGEENTIMTLTRGRERPPQPAAEAFDPRFAAALAALHDAAFPNTYYTAEQLMHWKAEEGRLLIRTEGDTLLGYAFFQLQPDAGQTYLDFIATEATARRRGVARGLLAGVAAESFADPRIQRVNLTVRASNEAAIPLYTSSGFRVERTLRGYRREGP
jgi:ribosomal protein S18 acetylase RimI-like enzyme